MENYESLLKELISYPSETEWIEFKANKHDRVMIGEDISALANSATLCGKKQAYMIWGIDNESRENSGTYFDPVSQKAKGNEDLEPWLRGQLSENADFSFHSIETDNGKTVVILTVYAALGMPVMFQKTGFVHIGSHTKKLKDVPSIEGRLWEILRNVRFEKMAAKSNLSSVEILNLLDVASYFDLKNDQMPSNDENIIHYLKEEGIVEISDNGLYAITNLGAVLFAKRMRDFPETERKALRVVQYKDKSRSDILKNCIFEKGYASCFDEAVKYIDALLPSEEVITFAIRSKVSPYPVKAIREAVANALIHQDFTLTGMGPVVEIFENRIEITNPGASLVKIDRIIDNPPKSRNEKLSSLMRRLGLCEELGTGWDNIQKSCEQMYLPTPKIDVYEENTKVTLYKWTPFSDLTSKERINACYMHACLKYVAGEQLTNTSLRERFGLDATQTNKSMISRLIKEALSKKCIKLFDEETSPRYRSYVPFWA